MTQSESDFNQALDTIQQVMDSVVEEGSDQQLFISAYVNGHFSVAASHCLQQKQYQLAALDDCMQQSFKTAFSQNELEPEDQIQAQQFWQTCWKSAV